MRNINKESYLEPLRYERKLVHVCNVEVDGGIKTYLFQVDDSINDHVYYDASVIDMWKNEAPRSMHKKHAIITMYT